MDKTLKAAKAGRRRICAENNSVIVLKNQRKPKQSCRKLTLCPICYLSLEFDELNKHLLTHTDGIDSKPYKCEYCPNRFTSESDANRHEFLHTGEFKYSCVECGETFPLKTSWIRHSRLQNHALAGYAKFTPKPGPNFKIVNIVPEEASTIGGKDVPGFSLKDNSVEEGVPVNEMEWKVLKFEDNSDEDDGHAEGIQSGLVFKSEDNCDEDDGHAEGIQSGPVFKFEDNSDQDDGHAERIQSRPLSTAQGDDAFVEDSCSY